MTAAGTDVLLINPPMRFYPMNPRSLMPPLGLLYLAAAARARGFRVAILDAAAEGFDRLSRWDRETATFGLDPDAVVDRARALDPSVVGISCLFSIAYPVAGELARRLRRALPRATIVLGGPHPTYLAAEILSGEPAVDYVVLGEGERSFGDLLEALRGGRSAAGIDGLARREGDGVAVSGKRSFVDDLDELPPPAWDLVDPDLYADRCVVPEFFTSGRGRHASILTTRGCPHSCAFCVSTGFWGHRYRKRSADDVLGEMERLITDFRIRRFALLDDNLLVDRKRTEAILGTIVRRGWDVEWYAPNGFGVWHIDDDILDLMQRSRMGALCLSPEATSPEIIESYVAKPVDLDRTREVVRLVEARGMRYFVQFILGFPDETRETLRGTLEYAAGLGPALVLFNMASPLPGTRLLRICRERGCLEEGFDFSRLNYTRSFVRTADFSGEEITDLAQRHQVLHNLGLLARSGGRLPWRYRYLLRKPIVLRELARIHAGRLLGLRPASLLSRLAR